MSRSTCVISRVKSPLVPKRTNPHSRSKVTQDPHVINLSSHAYFKITVGICPLVLQHCIAGAHESLRRLSVRSLKSCASSPLDGESGSLTDPIHNTSHEANLCFDVNCEHTPLSCPSRKNSFNLENDLTNTVAASEEHSAASTVPALLNSDSLCPRRKENEIWTVRE